LPMFFRHNKTCHHVRLCFPVVPLLLFSSFQAPFPWRSWKLFFHSSFSPRDDRKLLPCTPFLLETQPFSREFNVYYCSSFLGRLPSSPERKHFFEILLRRFSLYKGFCNLGGGWLFPGDPPLWAWSLELEFILPFSLSLCSNWTSFPIPHFRKPPPIPWPSLFLPSDFFYQGSETSFPLYPEALVANQKQIWLPLYCRLFLIFCAPRAPACFPVV